MTSQHSPPPDMEIVNSYPIHYGIALFPGFQALDVFGPMDVLNMVSNTKPLQLSILAETLDPVSTRLKNEDILPGPSIGQSVVPTHTFDDPPVGIEVLLVPGGRGTRDPNNTQAVVDFIKNYYPKLDYLLTVCTGSALAAKAGVLDGHKATTNKRSFDWVVEQGPETDWKCKARWVRSGNIWTSSGISAGIDMMYAFVADRFSERLANQVATSSEYTRNKDPDNDPFAYGKKKDFAREGDGLVPEVRQAGREPSIENVGGYLWDKSS